MRSTLRWVWWLFKNDIDLTKLKRRTEHFKELVDLEFGKSRTDELRKFAEEGFKESMNGLKEANERVDKLLGLTLVAIGWVAAQMKDRFPSWSLAILLLAAIILLCGRWKVTSRMPATFPDFVKLAFESGKEEQEQFNFDVGRQYYKATWDNTELTGLTQKRLLLAATILIAGLIAFACRV